jgi:predicted nucleic acid-binding protein
MGGTHARRWYYDACVLQKDSDIHPDIVNDNPKQGILSVTSHLALGEALGNILLKDKNQFDAFLNLIARYNKAGLLEIEGNDGIEKQMEKISEHGLELSFSDRVHLATALKAGCEQLHTCDGDFSYGPAKYHTLGAVFGLPSFCVKKH